MTSYTSLARFYDSLTSDVPYEQMADYYEGLFRSSSLQIKTVLDLACGTGTMLLLLAQRGYDMIGTDLSSDMLAVASEKVRAVQQGPNRALLLNQAMESLDLYGTVDAAICGLDGINYEKPELLPEAFRRVHLFLNPGGMFIFDVHTPSKLRKLDGEVFVDETEDVLALWRAEYDGEKRACRYGMDIFAREGRKWGRYREEHTEYAHEAHFLRDLLLKTGFSKVDVHGDLTQRSPTEKDERLYFTAYKHD